MPVKDHHINCEWQFEQYEHECTCGGPEGIVYRLWDLYEYALGAEIIKDAIDEIISLRYKVKVARND